MMIETRIPDDICNPCDIHWTITVMVRITYPHPPDDDFFIVLIRKKTEKVWVELINDKNKNERVIWFKWLFQLNKFFYCSNYLQGNNVVAMSTIVANRPPILCRMTSGTMSVRPKIQRHGVQSAIENKNEHENMTTMFWTKKKCVEIDWQKQIVNRGLLHTHILMQCEREREKKNALTCTLLTENDL